MAGKNDSRQELENAWRERLKRAAESGKRTSDVFDQAMAERLQYPHTSFGPDGVLEIQKARRSESKALTEYIRVLKIFNNLVIENEIPNEDPDSDLESD